MPIAPRKFCLALPLALLLAAPLGAEVSTVVEANVPEVVDVIDAAFTSLGIKEADWTRTYVFAMAIGLTPDEDSRVTVTVDKQTERTSRITVITDQPDRPALEPEVLDAILARLGGPGRQRPAGEGQAGERPGVPRSPEPGEPRREGK